MDKLDNRVLIFDASPTTLATAPFGEDAEGVIGQPDFGSFGYATTQSGFYYPNGLTFDSKMNRLFVADTYNNRVMEFSFVRVVDPELPAGTVGVPYNVAINTTASQGTILYSLLSGSLPAGLSFDSSTGVVSGTPTEVGDNTFSIEIIDNLAAEGTLSDLFIYTLAIDPATTSTSTTSSSGGVGTTTGGSRAPVLCNVGEKFSTETGFPCTTFRTSSQITQATSCIVSVTLKLGSKGDQVKCLQKNLKISADGNFGLKTKTAVMSLQRANKLKSDGIVGLATRKVLNSISK
jgi:peptidoglycan hydrolase-like protein with peptidoglycan-binding domain